MWTCGHGFVLPDVTQLPALGRFLRQEVDQFSCGELPSQPPLRAAVGAQPWLTWSHLLRSSGVVWMFTGIAWSRLAPLAGLFFGTTVAMAYLLLRLVSGRVLATVGAAFVLTSPLFIVETCRNSEIFRKCRSCSALAWLMAQLLTLSISTRRRLAVSAAYGAVLGFAIGFRNDALITIPPFVLLVLAARHVCASCTRGGGAAGHCCWPESPFVVFSSPVLRAYTDGGGAAMLARRIPGNDAAQSIQCSASAMGDSMRSATVSKIPMPQPWSAAMRRGPQARRGAIAGHSPRI